MDRKFCKNIIDSSKEAFLYKKKGGKKKNMSTYLCAIRYICMVEHN